MLEDGAGLAFTGHVPRFTRLFCLNVGRLVSVAAEVMFPHVSLLKSFATEFIRR